MAFIGHHSALGPTSGRERAFKAAPARYPRKLKPMVANSADGLDGGRLAMRELLASGYEPTSAVCVNDFMEADALRELRDCGLRDLRVKIGHIVFESLAGAARREIVLDSELVIRKSTGPARA